MVILPNPGLYNILQAESYDSYMYANQSHFVYLIFLIESLS